MSKKTRMTTPGQNEKTKETEVSRDESCTQRSGEELLATCPHQPSKQKIVETSESLIEGTSQLKTERVRQDVSGPKVQHDSATKNRQKNDNQSARNKRGGRSFAKVLTAPTQGNTNVPLAKNSGVFMLLLVGLPGSGKTTLACRLLEEWPDKFVRINQDELGTRRECERLTRDALSAGKCPVIDRCNFDKSQRQKFVSIAKEFSADTLVYCIVLDVDRKECIDRCRRRTGHPTIKPAEATKIISMVASQYKPPKKAGVEGLNRVYKTNSTDSAIEHIHAMIG